MMKRWITLLLALALLLLNCAALAGSLPMVVDDCGLFTDAEISEIETIITDIRNTYEMDAVVYTTRLNRQSDYALEQYADNWYDRSGYGLGEDHSGLLIFIDMGNRYVHIVVDGGLKPYLTDSRIDKILDAGQSRLSSGEYGSAVTNMLEKTRIYLRRGVQEGTILISRETGRRVSGIYNGLTGAEKLFSVIAGLGAALILLSTVKKRYALQKSTYAFNKQTQTASAMEIDDGQFTHHTVRRIPRSAPPPPGPRGGHGGGSHGGGGHHSTVHHTSSGHSHGGGGRHF